MPFLLDRALQAAAVRAQFPPPGAGTINALYYANNDTCSDGNVTDTLYNVPSGYCDGTGNARSAYYACDSQGNVIIYAFSKIGNCTGTPRSIINKTSPYCYTVRRAQALLCMWRTVLRAF